MFIGYVYSPRQLRATIKVGGSGGGAPPVPDLYSLTTLHPAIVNIADLEFDGTKYIDLNYVPKAGTKVDIMFRQTAYQKFLFGSRTSGSSSDSLGFCAYSSQIYAQYGNSQGATSYTMSLNENHFLTISKDGAFLDGYNLKSFDSARFVQSNLKMFLGSRNQNGTADNRMFTGMVYSMMIYENDSMIMALYPHNNGTVNGMYDIVGDNFYPLQ